jgi:hypothetical protein
LRIDAKSKEAFTFSQSGPARRLLDCVGDLEHSDASEHRARTGIDPRRSSPVTTAQNAAPEQRVLEPRQPRHIGASVLRRRTGGGAPNDRCGALPERRHLLGRRHAL